MPSLASYWRTIAAPTELSPSLGFHYTQLLNDRKSDRKRPPRKQSSSSRRAAHPRPKPVENVSCEPKAAEGGLVIQPRSFYICNRQYRTSAARILFQRSCAPARNHLSDPCHHQHPRLRHLFHSEADALTSQPRLLHSSVRHGIKTPVG